MTKQSHDRDTRQTPFYRGLPDRMEKRWKDNFEEFFYEHRVLTFILVGGSALILNLVIGSNAVLVLVTSLLYLALVFVNIDLKELQHGQNRILEGERRPLIEIANVEFSSDPCEYHISNFGEGYATHFAVAMKTQILANSRIETGATYVNITRANTDEFERHETTIPPNREAVHFEGTPEIGYRVGDCRKSKPVGDAVDIFLDEGINRINFQLGMVYANSLGEAGVRILSEARSVELERGMDFQELFEQSFLLGGYERDTFPRFGLGDIVFNRESDDLLEPGLL